MAKNNLPARMVGPALIRHQNSEIRCDPELGALIAKAPSIRIALITSNLGTGGVGRNMLNLANLFASNGLTTDLFLVNCETGSRLEELSREVGLWWGTGRARTSLFQLIKYINHSRPDILISGPSRINPLTILAAKMSLTPRPAVICTYRSDRKQELRNLRPIDRFAEFLTGFLYRYADRVVGVSRGVTRSLEETLRLKPGQAVTIYNPVWTTTLEDKMRAQVEHRWFRDDHIPVAIACGRLEKQKDYPTLLRAVRYLWDRNSPIRLLILGEGGQEESLKQYCSELELVDAVEFLGFQPNPYAYFSQSNIFVLSSEWEGFGNVLVEALAAGLPIVSTDCPAGPREILAEGQFGVLAPVGDHVSLGKAIVNALQNPPDPDVQKHRAGQFSDTRAAINYLSLGLEVLGQA